MWRNARRGSGYGERARDGAATVSHRQRRLHVESPRGAAGLAKVVSVPKAGGLRARKLGPFCFEGQVF